jgi:hypothetical protein
MTHVCTLYFVPEMCPWSAQIPRVDPSHKLTHICNNGKLQDTIIRRYCQQFGSLIFHEGFPKQSIVLR